MKNNIVHIGIAFIFSLTVFAFVSCNNEEAEHETETNTEEISQEDLMTAEFNVNGMTCGGCEKAVDNSIQKLSGINHTRISHLDSIAVVEFDKTKTNEDDIRKAISDAGYTVVE